MNNEGKIIINTVVIIHEILNRFLFMKQNCNL